MGRGGSLEVSILAFYSNNSSSNPAGYLNFLLEKTKINEIEARTGLSLKNLLIDQVRRLREHTI